MYSVVMTSDSKDQTHNVVCAYLKKFFNLIGELYWFPEVKKVVYISDGCAAQFKNRYHLWNLTQHMEDHNLKAEWHFCASGHGKGPCDAIGAMFKKTADRMTNFDQITTNFMQCLTSMVGEKLDKTKVHYIPMKDIEDAQMECRECQKNIVESTARQFKMQQSHFFETTGTIDSLNVANHSCSCDCCIHTEVGIHCEGFGCQLKTVSLVGASRNVPPVVQEEPNPTQTVPLSDTATASHPIVVYLPGNYVAAVYDGQWYVVEVQKVNGNEYVVQFMMRVGDHDQFRRCRSEAEAKSERASIPQQHILCLVDAPLPCSNSRTEFVKLANDDLERVTTLFRTYEEHIEDTG